MNDNVCPNCGYHEPEAQAADVSEAAAAEPAAAEPAATEPAAAETSAAEAASGMTEAVSSEAAAAEAAEPAAPKAAEPTAAEPAVPEPVEPTATEPAAPGTATQQTAAPNAGQPAQPYAAPYAGQTPPYAPPAQPYTPPAGQPYVYGQPGQGYAPYGAPAAAVDDKKSVGLNILSFFFPVIGLIIYLATKKDKPVRAKSMGKCALAGFIVGIVLSIVMFIISFTIGMRALEDYADPGLVLQDDATPAFTPDTNSQNTSALDWQNMTVVIDDVEISLPCTYSEFTQKTGYVLEDSEDLAVQLAEYEYTFLMSAENAAGQEMDIRCFNSGSATVSVQESLVVGVAVDAGWGDPVADVAFPQNVKVGDVYDLNAFREKFGEPASTYTGDSGYATVSWEDDNDVYNGLEIETSDGQTIEEISLDVYPAE